jgi:hypothetical protein
MRNIDKDAVAGRDNRRRNIGIQDRRSEGLAQIVMVLSQIHDELVQLRVQAANINVSLVRKR